jgi:uncharacterized SAM-binding protein YcdF (DUF218 family)
MQLFTSLLLPPVFLFITFIAGVVLLHRRPRTGKSLMAFSFLLLWLLSTPLVSNALLARLDAESIDAKPDFGGAQAIVILSAGRYVESHDFGDAGKDVVDAITLERLRRGASVYRDSRLPVLVTGGAPVTGGESMAKLMARALRDFNVPVTWLEESARDTGENAVYTARLLESTKIRTIVLVTHGWHMPRARRAFERAGLRVIPAATGLHHNVRFTPHLFRPGAAALYDSELFMHEAIGLAWYWIRGAGQ